MFGESAPDSELFAVADRMLEALAHDAALCAYGLGPTLAARQCQSTLAVNAEENCRIFFPTARIELP